MATLSIAELKDRILKPQRSALNAKTTNPTAASVPTPTMDQPRGGPHHPMEPGSVAYHPPSAQRPSDAAAIPSLQALYRGVASHRIPQPSEIFGLHAGAARPLGGTASPHAAVQRVPAPAGVPTVLQLPAPGQLTAASVTRQREHDRRMRAVSRRMNRATLKRRLAATTDVDTHPDLLTIPGPHSLPLPPGTSGWGGILSGLRQWYNDRPTHPSVSAEQDLGVHLEFDTDVVDALVYTVGRWLGLNAEQLRDSPGLRTLVSRNIQWFRSSPDWLKLAGLVLAKKLNQSLDCPPRHSGDTQRMLLDRMLHNSQREVSAAEPTASAPEEGPTPDTDPSASNAPEAPGESTIDPPPTPKPKRQRRSATTEATMKRIREPKAKPARKETPRKETSTPKKQIPQPSKPPRPRPKRLRALLSDPSDAGVSVDTDPTETRSVAVSPSVPMHTDPTDSVWQDVLPEEDV